MGVLKIYTRGGDEGQTGLLGGKRISKGSDDIEAIGAVDEFNAMLGLARSSASVRENALVDDFFADVQRKLFDVGASLADTQEGPSRITADDVAAVEAFIDKLTALTPPLKSFIIPAGDEGACRLHVARAVVRRAERAIVRLGASRQLCSEMTAYINRLSDVLFVAARFINTEAGRQDELWQRA